MKKFTIFSKTVLVLACVAGFSSCDSDKEFLTEKPKSIFSMESAYGSADQIQATLVSAYSAIQGLTYSSGVDTRTNQTDLGGGFMLFGGSASHIGSWSTSQGKDTWDSYYKIIAYCNQALMGADMSTVVWSNEDEKLALCAEARMLRGYAYLRLTEYFGGVPLVEEYIETLKFDYQRASRAESYKFAIEDLLYAYNNLSDYPTVGRAGKGAAAMCLSEAYLGLGVETGDSTCWTNAANYAQKVIDLHPLMTSRFGCRADASDTGSNLGVPNYNADGTAYSDLFYYQNPRLSDNTESVWVTLGADDYDEAQSYSSLRSASLISSFPVLRDVKLTGSNVSPWPMGTISSFYSGPSPINTDNPAISPNGIPWNGTPTWFIQEEAYSDKLNKNSSAIDDRFKEGVAVRHRYPITNPDHPAYGAEIYYGTEDNLPGWEELDKTVASQAMEFFAVFAKCIPMDAWSYDSKNYSTGGFGLTVYCDKYIMRSAEAYLLLAEAKLRGGDPDGAAKALNTLRARSNANPFDKSEITIHTILDERARELAFEEDRWATFLRMEPEVWKARVYAYGMYTWRAAGQDLNPNPDLFPVGQQFDYYTEPIRWNLWPIPLDYIDLNTDNPSGMYQNDGWDAVSSN